VQLPLSVCSSLTLTMSPAICAVSQHKRWWNRSSGAWA